MVRQSPERAYDIAFFGVDRAPLSREPRIAPIKLISGLSPSAARSAEGLALGPEQRAAAIETALASVPSAVTLFATRAAA